MKKVLVLICLEMFLFGCSPVHKSNSNYTQVRQVQNFEEIPTDLLGHIEKMGINDSSILNEYEGMYLNFIFRIDSLNFNLVGKKIGFLGSKKDFFKDEREWFYRGEKSGVGGTVLYIFDASQKIESGGYDAAIMYWKKVLVPPEEVVKRLKEKQ
jgi:hypothetical protein